MEGVYALWRGGLCIIWRGSMHHMEVLDHMEDAP